MSLILERREEQTVVINHNIVITIRYARFGKTRLAIDAPKDIPVHRGEIERENRNRNIAHNCPPIEVLPMKTLSALACLLLTSVALAATYQLPTVYEITGHSCGGPAPQYKVTGTNPDGTQTGLVFGYTSCSAGGRGAGNSYDTGCASVLWTIDGQMISYEVEWRTQGRYLQPASAGFGS